MGNHLLDARRAPGPTARPAPGRVLVADASPSLRNFVRATLEPAGYHVCECAGAGEALAAARAARPDVVLLDADAAGTEPVAGLTADPDLHGIPVVFLASRVALDDVSSFLRSGGHDHLKKPVEPAELIARVRSAMTVRSLRQELERRTAEVEQVLGVDSVTGLHNRARLEAELERIERDVARHDDDFSVALLEIDGFDDLRRRLGDEAGNAVLGHVARRICDALRYQDIAGRWARSTFLVLLPRTPLPGALRTAERIRDAVAASALDVGGDEIVVTVCSGCADYQDQGTDELIRQAYGQLTDARQVAGGTVGPV